MGLACGARREVRSGNAMDAATMIVPTSNAARAHPECQTLSGRLIGRFRPSLFEFTMLIQSAALNPESQAWTDVDPPESATVDGVGSPVGGGVHTAGS